MSSLCNMDGLPKWDGRVISSTGSTTLRECGKVGRGDRRWCLSVRRVSQVGPSLPFSPLSPPQPISIRQTYFLFRGDLTRRGSRQKRRQVSPYRNLWKGTKKAMEKLYFKGPFYIISYEVIFNTNTNRDVILLVWSMSSSQRRRCW